MTSRIRGTSRKDQKCDTIEGGLFLCLHSDARTDDDEMTAACCERMQQNISARKLGDRGQCIRQRSLRGMLHFGPDGQFRPTISTGI